MSITTVVLAAAALLLVLLLIASCLSRANRLDRLHVRADAARAALHAALERRAVVARAIATSTGDERLRVTAMSAERATASDREEAENDLGRLLVGLDRQALPVPLVDELADAEHRVMLSRRVHNDVVRDILALRSRRFVRWLRLAGNAPVPTYFEISDGLGNRDASAGDAAVPRRVGRVVLLDPAGRVLLLESIDPAGQGERCWLTPGGGLKPTEQPRAAAARALAEHTGLAPGCDQLEGPVWRRLAVLAADNASAVADEEFFVASVSGTGQLDRCENADPVAGGRRRWWTVEELKATDDVVYPRRLGDLVGSVRPGDWDGVTRSIS